MAVTCMLMNNYFIAKKRSGNGSAGTFYIASFALLRIQRLVSTCKMMQHSFLIRMGSSIPLPTNFLYNIWHSILSWLRFHYKCILLLYTRYGSRGQMHTWPPYLMHTKNASVQYLSNSTEGRQRILNSSLQ